MFVSPDDIFRGVIGKEIPIYGFAFGGEPPYTYAWDIDGDGEYDDIVGNDITFSWRTAGTYSIGLQATDTTLATATGIYTVIVVEWDPWIYDANHDDDIEIGEMLIALSDYLDGEMTSARMLQIVKLYCSD